jgi:putative protein kinase ArgK-like GTPase of G3E family
LTPAPPAMTHADGWTTPIQRTISTDGRGIPELARHIQEHLRYLRLSGNWAARESARLASEVEAILQQSLLDQFRASIPERRYNEVMRQVFDKQLSPWEAVLVLTDRAGKTAGTAEGSAPSRRKALRAGRQK